MICDRIENASTYYCLGPRFEAALRYLAEQDLSGLAVGEYPIAGRDLFLKIQEYETTDPEACKIELHKVYADVQFILRGEEEFGYIHKSSTQPKVQYDPAIDMALVSAPEMGTIIQKPGCFAIVFPQDAHQSCRVHKKPCRIKKAMIKVRL
jgi:YhcH/YjgK/YiaL family protein